MAGCGADTDANALIIALTQDSTFDIPKVDLSGDAFKFPDGAMGEEIKSLTIQDLTTGDIDGPGAFDALMRGFKAHLDTEWNANRITGDDYTKAYIALAESAMSQGIAFLLGKDNAFWQSQLAQLQAFTARVALETTKVALAAAQFDAANQKATYALTKLRMSSESAAYCTAQYTLANLLPLQKDMLGSQKSGQDTENATAQFNLTEMLPKQAGILTIQGETANTEWATARYNLEQLLPKQLGKLSSEITGLDTANQRADQELQLMFPKELEMVVEQVNKVRLEGEGQNTANASAQYTLTNMLPQQFMNLQKQNEVLREQVEAQRAQTRDGLSDGTPLGGVLGKQKELYAQQITSYQRDSELKVAKIFSDSWITQKTIDEGLTPPNSFTNAEIEKVMTQLRAKAGIGV